MIRRQALAVGLVAAVAIAASASGLANGFAYDDVVIVASNPRVHALGAALRSFSSPYWPDSYGAALYRPVTLLVFAAEWTLGNGSPRVFHALSVLLYVAVCIGVFMLLRAALQIAATVDGTASTPTSPSASAGPDAARDRAGELGALGGAILFAAHPVHVEAVGNVVGQSELLAALAVVLAMVLYLRHRQRGAVSVRATVGMAALYLTACMSKEHAIVLPALVVFAELTLFARTSARPPALRARVLPVAVLALTGVVYLALRANILGGLGGEIPSLALAGAPLQHRVLTLFRVAPEWLRLLLWPAHLSADYSPRELEVATSVTASVMSGATIVLGALLLAWTLQRRFALASFGILWTATALIPVSNLLVLTGILLAERTLFLASVGVAIIGGGVIALSLERASGLRSRELAVAGLVGVLACVGTVRSALRQPVWKNNDTFFPQLLLDAPLSYRAHWAYGAQLFHTGSKEKGEEEMRIAIALFPGDPDVIEDLATRYLRSGLCAPAIPAFRNVLALAPDRATARMGLVACLLRQGDYRSAGDEARRGLRQGGNSGEFQRLAFVADSLEASR